MVDPSRIYHHRCIGPIFTLSLRYTLIASSQDLFCLLSTCCAALILCTIWASGIETRIVIATFCAASELPVLGICLPSPFFNVFLVLLVVVPLAFAPTNNELLTRHRHATPVVGHSLVKTAAEARSSRVVPWTSLALVMPALLDTPCREQTQVQSLSRRTSRTLLRLSCQLQ